MLHLPSQPINRSGWGLRAPRWFAAISGVHLLIVAAGVLALVANLALLRRGEAPLAQMAVTVVDLAPGRILQPVDVSEPIAAGLISELNWSDTKGG